MYPFPSLYCTLAHSVDQGPPTVPGLLNTVYTVQCEFFIVRPLNCSILAQTDFSSSINFKQFFLHSVNSFSSTIHASF